MVETDDNGSSAEEDTGICLNCYTRLVGDFCHCCGQSESVRRYGIKALGVEFYNQLKKVDATATVKTFVPLLLRPGLFVSEYLAGKRVDFLNPVKYFLYSFALQILLIGVLFWWTNDLSIKELTHVEYSFEIITLISTVFWGVSWKLFFRRSGLNLVENIMAAIFFVAQLNFFGLIIQLSTFPLVRYGFLSKEVVQYFEIAIHIGYSFQFGRQVFKEPSALLIPKQIILVVFYLALLIFLFIAVKLVGL